MILIESQKEKEISINPHLQSLIGNNERSELRTPINIIRVVKRMFKLEMRLFGIHINIDIFRKVSADKSVVNADKHIESYDENINEINENAEESDITLSEIELTASRFEEELKRTGAIFDMPDISDYPKRYGITDDVEIITERYEKEFEDIMEGRR